MKKKFILRKKNESKSKIISLIKSLLRDGSDRSSVLIQLCKEYPRMIDLTKKKLITFPEPSALKKYRVLNNLIITGLIIVALLKVFQLILILLFNDQFDYSPVAACFIIVVTLGLNYWLIKCVNVGRSFVYTIINMICVLTLVRISINISPYLMIRYIQIGGLVGTFIVLLFSVIASFKIHPDYVFFSITKRLELKWNVLIKK